MAIQRNAKTLLPGCYVIVTTLVDQNGQQIGSHPIDWPGHTEAFRGVRILNNLVSELLLVEAKLVGGSEVFGFSSPKRRWLHLSATVRDTDGPNEC